MRDKYSTHVLPYLKEISTWAKMGVIDKDIAKNLGVAYSTFRTYVRKYPELKEMLSINKDLANAQVSNAIFEKSKGYTRTLKKPVKVKEIKYDNGKKVSEIERIEIAEEEIHVPADMTAAKMWQYNRDPNNWKEKSHIETEQNVNVKKIEDFF